MDTQTTMVAQFSIPYYRYLNPEGEVERSLPSFAQHKPTLIELYRMMVMTRLFDKKAISLQRTGKLGTYPSNLGQEAIGAGIGSAMQKDDVFCPYYRDYAAQFFRGIKMEEILLYWGGDERGSHFQANKYDLPICVPIASQTLHAAGVAAAIKYRQENKVVVTALGDGGTSRGDFYEAMNIAGVWELPLVFVINNNQWAISVPRVFQTKAQTLAQKAIGAGLEGWQIDGNDVMAVKDALDKAIYKARQGKGATVIEALSYRMCDHTTADDASRYRKAEELLENERKDPIKRLRNYMLQAGFWNEEEENALLKEMTFKVEEAVKAFEAFPPPQPEEMFDSLYATLPSALQAQKEAVQKEGN